jgi:RHS repeat-associated protein
LRIFEERVGAKNYELSNHLGNVLATIGDKTIFNTDHYNGIVYSAQLYYPFGWEIPTLSYAAKKYRFGFNGKEDDREWHAQDYGFRLYTPREGRFIGVDPITAEYPELTPYQFASNSPIAGVDLDGLEFYFAPTGEFLGHYSKYNDNQIRVVRAEKVEQYRQYFLKKNSDNILLMYTPSISSFLYSSAPAVVQSKVSQSIYKMNISNRNVNIKIDRSPPSGKGAHTENDNTFSLNVNIIINKMKEPQEFLFDDYYNQVNIFVHEEEHAKEFSNKDFTYQNKLICYAFKHMDIAKIQVKHSSFKNTTLNYKNYLRGVMTGYLDEQRLSISGVIEGARYIDEREKIANTPTVKYWRDTYNKNIDFINKNFDAKIPLQSFKGIINHGIPGK